MSLTLERPRAVPSGWIETELSVRWVMPKLADALIEAAEGRARQLS